MHSKGRGLACITPVKQRGRGKGGSCSHGGVEAAQRLFVTLARAPCALNADRLSRAGRLRPASRRVLLRPGAAAWIVWGLLAAGSSSPLWLLQVWPSQEGYIASSFPVLHCIPCVLDVY